MNKIVVTDQVREALRQVCEGSEDSKFFECISRWRMSSGDAAGSSKWHYWSIDPSDAKQIRLAALTLWRQIGDVDMIDSVIANEQVGWDGLLFLITARKYVEAKALQAKLLVELPELELSKLLDIFNAWLLATQQSSLTICKNSAYQIMILLLDYKKKKKVQFEVSVINNFALLLQLSDRLKEASFFWKDSIRLQPNQLKPYLGISKIALDQNKPHTAEFYSRRALNIHPKSLKLENLQIKSLEAIGANGSLALLGKRSWPSSWHRRQSQWRDHLASQLEDGQVLEGCFFRRSVTLPPQKSWQNQQHIAVFGDADGLFLAGLAQEISIHPSDKTITLWLIASRDPQLQLFNIKRLNLQSSKIKITTNPGWSPRKHHMITVAFVSHRAFFPNVLKDRPNIDLWFEKANPHRWEKN